MNVYHYHPDTYAYLGVSEAKIDPLETATMGEEVYLIPAHATIDQPPQALENQKARRTDDSWELVDDYRGQDFWDKDTGTKVTITELGMAIPAGYPTVFPPAGIFNPKWNGATWIETAIVFQGVKVQTKTDVDRITARLIANLGEEKAKTEKLLAGSKTCTIWDDFIAARATLLKEGDDFIATNNLS
jgi:hypothetical protein